MYQTILSNLKTGSLFHVIPTDSSPIYVRDHYERSTKKYCYHRYIDQKERFSRGNTLVYVSDLDDLKAKHLATDMLTDKLV